MTNLELQKKKRIEYFYTVFVFLVYFYLAYKTPLTHDDWTWGTSDGIERLKNWFEDYNGRYMGNLFELFLTRVFWLRILIMSACATALVILPVKLSSNNKSSFSYLLSFVLFLAIPINIFAQTYAWVAGFSNYIPSLVCVLIYLLLVKNIFEDEIPKYNNYLMLLIIPMGIMTQLFVEHVTLYTLLLAIFVIVFSYIKYKKFFAIHWAFLVSTIIGAIIMFSNGAYAKIFSGEDTYRSVDAAENVGLFRKIFDVYTEQMYPMLFMNNKWINIVIAVICISIIIKAIQNHTKYSGVIANTLLAIFVLYPLYPFIVLNDFKVTLFNEYTNEFEAFFSLLFYFSIVITILLFIDHNKVKYKSLFYVLSAGVISAPLIFVQPFGPRNFLASYTFFVLLAVEMGSYIISQKSSINYVKYVNKFMAIVSILLVSLYCYVFTLNAHVDKERIDYINEQLKEDKTQEIPLTRLPYESFLQVSTPRIPGYQYNTFKEYHGFPENINLKIIPYSEWKELKEK